MVAWSSDTLLAVLAYGSTLVATLRAGSRALYFMEHDQIDVMEGPLILGPNDVIILPNGTATIEISPLWELASVFQESVRLALDPDSIEYRVLSVGVPQEGKEDAQEREPYSLSPFPTRKPQVIEEEIVVTDLTEESTDESTLFKSEDVEILAEDTVGESSHDRLSERKPFIPRISSYLPRASSYLPRVSSYFLRVSFHGMLHKVPFIGRWTGGDASDDEDSFSFDETEFDGTFAFCPSEAYVIFSVVHVAHLVVTSSEWDFDYCISTDIPYNTSKATVQWAEITAYAPATFADLRYRFGIPEGAFRQSILQSGPYVSFQSNSKGAARAGK